MLLANEITTCESNEEPILITRVPIRVQNFIQSYSDSSPPRRKVKRFSRCITLYNYGSTTIDDVGLQLWSGAILLADFLVHISANLTGVDFFEFGAGTGLTSLVASLLPCRRIIATDYRHDILDLINRNIAANSHLLPLFSPTSPRAAISTALLDWTMHSCLDIPDYDQDTISSRRVYLAADCIYDDDLTFHFFCTAAACMRNNEHLFLTLEKRYNFVTSELALVPHAYSYFSDVVKGSVAFRVYSKKVFFVGNRIDIDFPSYLEYQRSDNLELWDIAMHDAGDIVQ